METRPHSLQWSALHCSERVSVESAFLACRTGDGSRTVGRCRPDSKGDGAVQLNEGIRVRIDDRLSPRTPDGSCSKASVGEEDRSTPSRQTQECHTTIELGGGDSRALEHGFIPAHVRGRNVTRTTFGPKRGVSALASQPPRGASYAWGECSPHPQVRHVEAGGERDDWE